MKRTSKLWMVAGLALSASVWAGASMTAEAGEPGIHAGQLQGQQVAPSVQNASDSNVCAPADVSEDAAPMSDCFNCGRDSARGCAPMPGKARMQCNGSRQQCRDRGCRITGTSSCSSAGNVGQC